MKLSVQCGMLYSKTWESVTNFGNVPNLKILDSYSL